MPTEGKKGGNKMNIKLTPRQIEAVLWAIQIADASYEGWTNAEKGTETIADLKHLLAVEAKLLMTPNAGA
jgi:hypothetical protein